MVTWSLHPSEIKHRLVLHPRTISNTLISAGYDASQNALIKESIKNRFYGVPAVNFAFVDRSNILANMAALGGLLFWWMQNLGVYRARMYGKDTIDAMILLPPPLRIRFCFWPEVDSWSMAIDLFFKMSNNLGSRRGKRKGQRLKDGHERNFFWTMLMRARWTRKCLHSYHTSEATSSWQVEWTSLSEGNCNSCRQNVGGWSDLSATYLAFL